MSDELRSAAFTISVNGEEKGTSIVTITKNLKNLEEVEGELNKTAAENVTVTKQQTTTKKEANAMARKTVAEYNKKQKAIETVTNQIVYETKMLSLSSSEQQVYNAQVRASVDPLSAEGKAIEALVLKQQKLIASSTTAQGSFRALRGQAQNVGWQMQDVAVQMQAGTDAMVIISQQGSQLASGFGPSGAVVGALIAVGGAIAGVILKTDGLAESQKITAVTTDGITDKLYEQAKAGEKLSAIQKEYLANIQSEKIENYEKELKKQTDGIKEQSTQLERLEKLSDKRNGKRGTAEAVTEAEKSLSRLKSINEETLSDLETAKKNLENLMSGTKFEEDDSVTADRLKTEAEAIDASIAAWKDKLVVIEYSERETALYNATVDATTKAEKESLPEITNAINAYYDKAESIEANTESMKDLMKQIEAEEKAAIKRAKRMDAIEDGQTAQKKGDDPIVAEMVAYEQNMANLQAMKDEAGEYAITEQMRLNSLMESEEERHTLAMEEAYLTQAENYISMASVMTNSLSGIVDIFSTGGESIMSQMDEMTGAQQVMFVATQAFAAANSVLAGYQQAANWANSPLAQTSPTFAAAMGEASIALGYVNAGAVMGVTFAGAFDEGGVIPSGQAGIVAEFGDELLGGTMVYNNSGSGVNVTGREDTAALMAGNGGTTNSITQHITVTGNGDQALVTAMQAAAEQGAKAGYNMVAKDFKNNRGISTNTRRN